MREMPTLRGYSGFKEGNIYNTFGGKKKKRETHTERNNDKMSSTYRHFGTFLSIKYKDMWKVFLAYLCLHI